MRWPWAKRPKVKVKTGEGERGRWRWFAYDELDKMIASGPPFGFSSRGKARGHVERLFKQGWEVLHQ